MLEKIPAGLGYALRRVRAGFEKIVSEDAAFASIPDTIMFESPAFDGGGPIPARYTEDGEKISPPLTEGHPTRAQLVGAMKGHGVAKGLLTGTCERPG